MNLADKLSEKLLEVESGCWEFIGGRTGSGYGAITNGRGYYKGAHVLAYEIEKGPVPKGMFVLHSCDNPACCRPDHLFLGDYQTNKDDEVAKGRHVFGERVGNHKLSEDEVRLIKSRLATGDSQSSIAREYNVSATAIHFIAIGKTWGWLE